MSGKVVVLVIDGFGIGAMRDVNVVRPSDIGANTLKSLLAYQPDLNLPNLAKLGLMNAYGIESNKMKFSPKANYGMINLMHDGADTFYGHQEMMGSLPRKPKKDLFNKFIDKVSLSLENHGHDVKFIGKNRQLLLIDNCITIGDNLETDAGLAYNVTTSFDYVSFDEVVQVGHIVRESVKVPRVIVFGGKGVKLINLLASIHEKNDETIGVSAPEAGVYNKNYQVLHMGYGVDSRMQCPTLLGERGISVTLIGKVADIVSNDYGRSLFAVDTTLVMDKLINEIKNLDTGFICANVQETDLAGHSENPEIYIEKLKIVDDKLTTILNLLREEDLLMVVADHGNDPSIGHSRHTREQVPLLVYNKKLSGLRFGTRRTLSDIGSTALNWLEVDCHTENGSSIFKKRSSYHD
ncbi:MAG: phosphopentomutase [Firmicutes bacterium HGW-Firmicutes-7]|nr:MAG: phosphopentomutase [Firmicutes bacterium HGW-Firmicutes-7]